MKVNPVYKCKRCSKMIIKDDIEVEHDALEGVNMLDTHVCDMEVVDSLPVCSFGFTELVGFDEVEYNG